MKYLPKQLSQRKNNILYMCYVKKSTWLVNDVTNYSIKQEKQPESDSSFEVYKVQHTELFASKNCGKHF